jgi:SAM-dependent methyltransferase
MKPHRQFVDYQNNAATYRTGRDLRSAQLDLWASVVSDRLPSTDLRVVIDGGAGTGAFLPMWRALGATCVLALEPNEAMRTVAAERAHEHTSVLAGDLTSMPVATGAADVVWVSAVIHHVPDRSAAFAEITRVLQPRGRLLLRGYIPNLSRIPWLEYFPGAERATARFPTLRSLETDASGLETIDVTSVDDVERVRPSEAISWIRAMRDADTLLTALTDEEIEAGLEELNCLPDVPLAPATLTLLTLHVRD